MMSDRSINKTKKEAGMKSKMELTADTVRKLIEEKKPSSFTRLAHMLGYKGSVSSSLTKKFRALLPGIDSLLQGTANSNGKPEILAGNGKSMVAKALAKDKSTKGAVAAKGKPVAKETGKWPRDPRNPFRGGSYATCYDILASHKQGLPKDRLITLLAEATGKDLVHAGYDAQVVLSARPNDDGLNNNDSPRNRSCRPGFWISRENDCVTLMVG